MISTQYGNPILCITKSENIPNENIPHSSFLLPNMCSIILQRTTQQLAEFVMQI